MHENNYIIEYIALGKSVKVTAFDPETLTEVSIVGSTSTSKKQLAKIAIRKLIYVIEKNSK